MGAFVYRDYASPRVAFYNNKVALKELWGKIQPTEIVDGIEVFKKNMYFFDSYGTGLGYTESYKGIRSDPEFKRFIKAIGTSHKQLRRSYRGGMVTMYFHFVTRRLNYNTTTAALMTDKFNQDYAQFARYATTINPDDVIIYPQWTQAGTQLYYPAVDINVERYSFYYDGAEHDVTPDGYFGIHPTGMIYMTLAGAVSDANKVKYSASTPNGVTYTIKVTYKNPLTSPAYISKMLLVNRDYVDIKITVGGVYTRAVTVDNVALELTAINLPTVRSIIEANPTKYISSLADDNNGIQNILDEKLYSLSSLQNAVAAVQHDTLKGHALDVLALYDTDHSVYEVVEDCFNEQLHFSEVGDVSADVVGTTVTSGTQYSNKMNVSYTYYKRYKVIGNVLDTSALITNITAASNRFETAMAKILTPTSLTAKTLYRENENVMYESELQEAVVYLNVIDVEDAAFYGGQLRVSAFNAMTPNEFAMMVAESLRLGYYIPPADGGSFLDKVVAVIIVVIAAVVVLVVFVATGNISYALTAANVWLSVAGMLYARHIGSPTGMRIIGAAQQTVSVMMMVVAVANIAYAVEQYIADQAMVAAAGSLATTTAEQAAIDSSSTQLMVSLVEEVGAQGMAAYGSAVAAGLVEGGTGDSQMDKILGAGMALYGAYNAGVDITTMFSELDTTLTNSGLLGTTFKGLTNVLKLVERTVTAYMQLDTLNNKQIQYAENEHASKEPVEAHAYMMQNQSLDNDALNLLETRVLIPQMGGYGTDMVVERML